MTETLPAPRDPMLGRVLPRGYEVVELIGSGGMARVYRAVQSTLSRNVAVKFIAPEYREREDVTARFFREAQLASRLNHPNIVSIYDFGETEDRQLYLVMEYLTGIDLGRALAKDETFPVERVVDIFAQVLEALVEAHSQGVVHRDVKPENIYLERRRTSGDFVKLLDFGIAKPTDTRIKGQTLPGLIAGTPQYLAPEQIQGSAPDPRSDLYAVGVVLFETLTMQHPIVADSVQEYLRGHLMQRPADVRSIRPDLHSEWSAVLERALEKDPSLRFQTAHELAGALEKALVATRPSRGATPSACPTCRAPLRRGRFCGECGTDILGARSRSTCSLPKAMTGLIERDLELRWLDECREAGQSVLVNGTLGAGKTSLVTAFAEQRRRAGDRVLFVRPDPYRARVLGAGLRALLAELTGAEPESLPRTRDARVRALSRAMESASLPAWRTTLVVEDHEDLDEITQTALLDLMSPPSAATSRWPRPSA